MLLIKAEGKRQKNFLKKYKRAKGDSYAGPKNRFEHVFT